MKKLAFVVAVTACGFAVNVTPAFAVTPGSLIQTVLPRAEEAGAVESAEVIEATLGTARAALDPQWEAGTGGRRLTTPVDVVVMHGHFSDVLEPTPRGAAAPNGAVMAFTFDSATGDLIEVYVGSRSPQTGSTLLQWSSPSSHLAKATRVGVGRRRFRARSATWGAKCSMSGNHHCYALAVWEMAKTEHIYGSESAQYTSQMVVPNWESNDFVSNEEWLDFFNSPVGNPYWIEMGQIGGYAKSCCSIYAFLAYQNHTGYHIGLLAEQPKATLNYYTMRAAGGGVWCYYLGPVSETYEGCTSGFENVATRVEDGAEMADESAPTNAGYVESNWVAEGGPAYQWNFATDQLVNESGKVGYNGMCVSKYTPWNYAGNINYGSYGECP